MRRAFWSARIVQCGRVMNTLLSRGNRMRLLEKLQPLALLLLRCGLALSFIYHGYPKLFGKRAIFVAAFERLGLPWYFVYIAGVIEVFGGLALAVGLCTRVAGLLLLLDMAAAMWKYNFNEGIYAVREYELPLVLGLAALALATTGAGPFSFDHLIYLRKGRLRSKAETANYDSANSVL